MSATPEIPAADVLRNFPSDGGEAWNRLVFEQSPYLLQHAANPVKWFPWGDDAFKYAAAVDKPIFLSIGYATCHWCHVMARESFEDEQVAALLNQHFIPVKVDREERPDIDQVYMAACQAMTGQGGWPLTCFLMPDGEVFYAGTYYPKSGQGNRPGMMQLLPGIAGAWQEQRDDVRKAASELTGHLRQQSAAQSAESLDDNCASRAFAWFKDNFDAEYGGFGQAPKFPTPHQYQFLLRYWRQSGDADALSMVETSLTAMRLGGVFDHVGLGFHRYSTDARWLLPHFEKMLYDQAMLLVTFSETYAATGKTFYREAALDIVRYVTRDLAHARGGFFSAEDADSEGEEGKFYVWALDELKEVLTEPELRWFISDFNLEPEGNFSDEATHQKSGANIPHLTATPQSISELRQESPEQWAQGWQGIRSQLFERREKRVRPLLDDKVLTDWNGLMIGALARSSLLLGAPDLLEHAKRAWNFVQAELTEPADRLLKRFRNDQSGLPAHLDDYAFMIWAALELHQATLDLDYLEQAIRWQQVADELFADPDGGGYFFTAPDTSLVVRQKPSYDGAIPSGNSFMARNLAHLYQLTGEASWQSAFERVLGAMARQVNHFPPGSVMMLIAADLMHGQGHNLVLAGNTVDADVLAPLEAKFLPTTVWLGVSREDSERAAGIAPFTATQTGQDGDTLYLCQHFTCERPITGKSAIEARLTALTNAVGYT